MPPIVLALFLDDLRRAQRLADSFGEASRSVDGLFPVFETAIGETPARLYAVEGGADAAYAAGRLAARRGAAHLLAFPSATAAQEELRQGTVALGDLVPISAVYTAPPPRFDELLRLLPTSAASLPLPLAGIVQDEPIWTGGAEGIRLFSASQPIHAPALAEALLQRLGTVAFDLQAEGFVRASADSAVPLRLGVCITRGLSLSGIESAPHLEIEASLEQAFRDLLLVS